MIDNAIAVLVIAFAVIWGLVVSIFIAICILFCWDYCVSKQKTARNSKK